MIELVYLAECEYDTALGGSVAKIMMHTREDAEKLRKAGKRKGFTVKAIYGLQIFSIDDAKKVIEAEKKEHARLARKYPNGFISRNGTAYVPEA